MRVSKGHHLWIPGQAPPEIRPHSLAKHRIIERYLKRYVEVLTSNLRIPEFRLTLVDGFAGGGAYWDPSVGEERPGSPILMLRAMQEAAQLAQQYRHKEFFLSVEYFFVEKTPDSFKFLQQTIRNSEFCDLEGETLTLLEGKFEDYSDSIVSRVKARRRGERAIFLLDQCGYKDVPLHAINSILSQLPNAEVILTFATDSLIDYLSTNEQTQKILGRVGLEISPTDVLTLKQEQDWRRAIQRLLHTEIHAKSGARFYTPFFIRSPDAHRDYWLIHLSGHAKARDVMVELHWDENTSFSHFGRSGLNMLGYDPAEDFELTGQHSLPAFYFDETAMALTQVSLFDELPGRIHPFADGIQFQDFFGSITNETPASSFIIKRVLAELSRTGEIKIRDKTGNTVRQRGIQKSSDVITPSSGRSLFT
ncbi:MAG: three-Cys-motif partner protein TcmP [Planctomycetaceae bacterium]|nr:three-Cys-motif partner protein TcmP [Planctomycetaceae bacterium]